MENVSEFSFTCYPSFKAEVEALKERIQLLVLTLNYTTCLKKECKY